MAALVAWRRQVTGQDRHAPRLLALLCVLLLVFPVISATDDLHPTAQALLEDSSKRNQKAGTAIRSQATPFGHAAVSMLRVASFAIAPLLQVAEWLRPAATPSAQTGVTFADPGRAPPSSLLS